MTAVIILIALGTGLFGSTGIASTPSAAHEDVISRLHSGDHSPALAPEPRASRSPFTAPVQARVWAIAWALIVVAALMALTWALMSRVASGPRRIAEFRSWALRSPPTRSLILLPTAA